MASRRTDAPAHSNQRAHHIAQYREHLDRTFAALVDPTRRAILARLEREDSASVSELAEPCAIKLPAVMKHLGVLAGAGLITRSKVGRVVQPRTQSKNKGVDLTVSGT